MLVNFEVPFWKERWVGIAHRGSALGRELARELSKLGAKVVEARFESDEFFHEFVGVSVMFVVWDGPDRWEPILQSLIPQVAEPNGNTKFLVLWTNDDEINTEVVANGITMFSEAGMFAGAFAHMPKVGMDIHIEDAIAAALALAEAGSRLEATRYWVEPALARHDLSDPRYERFRRDTGWEPYHRLDAE